MAKKKKGKNRRKQNSQNSDAGSEPPTSPTASEPPSSPTASEPPSSPLAAEATPSSPPPVPVESPKAAEAKQEAPATVAVDSPVAVEEKTPEAAVPVVVSETKVVEEAKEEAKETAVAPCEEKPATAEEAAADVKGEEAKDSIAAEGDISTVEETKEDKSIEDAEGDTSTKEDGIGDEETAPIEDEETKEEEQVEIKLCIDPNASATPEFSASALSPTQDPQLAGYTPDCGTKNYKFLSMAKVRRERGLTHPMKYSDTEVDAMGNAIPERYPVLKTGFGAHSFYRLETDSTVLNKFGIGMVLYFKYLKVMGWMFFIAIILSIPSMSVYVLGGNSDFKDVKLAAKENPTALLGMTSIGHLGEGESVCKQIKYGESLDLSCQYGEIGFIKASYSEYANQGSCSCPARQQVDVQTGMCTGRRFRSCHGFDCRETCDRNGPGACYLGLDPVEKKACCAWERQGDFDGGAADFTNLQIQHQPECQSRSIEPILKGLCLGKAACSFRLESNLTHVWEPTEGYDNKCPDGGHQQQQIECEARLDDASNYKSCPEKQKRGLIVYARCFTTKITLTSDWSLKVIGWHYITRQGFLGVAVLCDILTCIAFLQIIRWMKKKEKQETTKVNSDEITAKDYTIQLMHLPKHKDVPKLYQDLKSHLETVLSAKPMVYKELAEIKIADINFGLTNAVQIAAMRKRGVVARKLDIASQKIAKFKALQEKLEPAIFEKRLDKMLNKMRALDEHLAKYDTWLDEWEKENSGKKLRAVTAFVTFEEEEGYLRCLHEYPALGPLHRLFQPYHKRFLKKRMKIQPAPDPTDIIWENLDYTYFNRMFRNWVVNMVTVGLLLISFILIYVTKMEKAKREREFGRPAYCPVGITEQMVIEDQQWEAYNKTTKEELVECYCQNALKTKSFTEMLDIEFVEKNPAGTTHFYCATWAEAFLSVQVLTIGAVLVVVAINAVLKQVLAKLVLKEKHHTLSGQVISVVKKIFLAQFINTAVLLILINANLEYFSATGGTAVQEEGEKGLLFSGKYSDFDVAWYQDVGIALMLTMMINTIAPHAGIFFTYLKLELFRCLDRQCSCDESITNKSTQRDLEAMYRGPKFELATRYAQSLTTIFIAFLFSSGMPLLLVLGLMGIVVTYWTDKFTFLRVVRTPPGYDEKIAQATGSLLPYAVLFHCLFGMWMYSNQNIFQMNFYEDNVMTENSWNDQEDPNNNWNDNNNNNNNNGWNDNNNNNWNNQMANMNDPHYNDQANDIPDYWSSRPGEIFERLTMMPVVLMFSFTVTLVLLAFVRYVILRKLASFIQSLCPICVRWLQGQKPPENYPNYFDTIPMLTLREKLSHHSCKEALRDKYSTALDNRVKSANSVLAKMGKHDGKSMLGCHSYDIVDNKEYIDAFAMDSKCATKRRLTAV